ncbi:MAG: glycoside hydrolase N-terminal domain-containing protein [bacterium]
MNHASILTQPAVRWEDALPAGNGTTGALVFGSICRDTIILNREDLWLPLWPRPTVPNMAPHLAPYRRLLEQGRFLQADAFWRRNLRAEGWPETSYTNPFCAGLDLALEQETPGAFTRYQRRLDFDTGEARVSWRADSQDFERRLFVSRTDDVVALRISGPRRGIGVRLAFRERTRLADNRKSVQYPRGYTPDELPVHVRASASGQWLVFDGQFARGGGFGAVAKVTARGGRLTGDGAALCVNGADEVLVLIHVFRGRASAAAVHRAQATVNRSPGGYPALLRRHVAEHRRLYRRLSLDITGSKGGAQTNEKLLANAYQGRVANALIERMFHFGRYLFLAATQARGLPPNLQGVWNGDHIPAWSCDYTLDENVQMMHWPVMSGNMAELMEPYFRYFEASLRDWRTNARRFFGCRGVLAPLRQSDHGLLSENMPYLMWTAGAGWLAQPFYDYWLYTGDRDFLRTRAVPFLKEVARFYEDFLYEGPDARLTVCPSMSPENVPDIPGGTLVTINPVMDVAVCREVLGNLCDACRTLGIEAAGVRRWEALRARLPDYAVNADGALREWLRPELKDNYHHRHLSHLYGLFPGTAITGERTPALFEACRIAVQKRLVVGIQSQTSWSLAHMANVYARLGDGDKALECLDLIVRSCTGENLWTYHNDWRRQGITMDEGWLPPFQMDANLGLTAAVQEMLMFSTPGVLKLLPALPRRWSRGRVTGLRGRGQISVDLAWDVRRRSLHARLRSATTQSLAVCAPAWAGQPQTPARPARRKSAARKGAYVTLSLPAGRTIEIRYGG